MADFVEVRIELQPHMIKQHTRLGEVDVFVNQYRIRAHTPGTNPVFMGYVGSNKGAPINFMLDPDTKKPWPEAIKQAVRDGVDDALGKVPNRRESEPPPPPTDEDYDDEDEYLEEEDE